MMLFVLKDSNRPVLQETAGVGNVLVSLAKSQVVRVLMVLDVFFNTLAWLNTNKKTKPCERSKTFFC